MAFGLFRASFAVLDAAGREEVRYCVSRRVNGNLDNKQQTNRYGSSTTRAFPAIGSREVLNLFEVLFLTSFPFLLISLAYTLQSQALVGKLFGR